MDMKLRKTLAALSAAVLLASAAVPASAHHGGRVNTEAAVSVLGAAAQTVLNQAYTSHQCVGAAMASVGKLEEFQAARLRLKQEQLQAQVENGQRTQEEADQILANLQERQQNCNGTGNGYCDGSYHDSGICDGTCAGGSGQGGYGYCDGSYHDSGICDGTCVGSGACDGTGQGWGNGNGQGNGGAGNGQGGHHGGNGHRGGGNGCGRWN